MVEGGDGGGGEDAEEGGGGGVGEGGGGVGDAEDPLTMVTPAGKAESPKVGTVKGVTIVPVMSVP